MNTCQRFDGVMSGDSFKAVCARAIEDASAVLGRWSRGVVALELKQSLAVDWAGVRGEIGLWGNRLTAWRLPLEGQTPGAALLACQSDVAGKVALALLRRVSSSDGGGDVPADVLVELGTVMGCALANSMNVLLGADLVAGAPELNEQLSGSTLTQSLLLSADPRETWLAEIDCYCAGYRFPWWLLVMPADTLRIDLPARHAPAQPSGLAGLSCSLRDARTLPHRPR